MHRCLMLMAVGCLVGSSGCMSYALSTGSRLFLAGRYTQLAQYLEAKQARAGSLEVDDLSYLCAAYSKLQQYDKLIPCGEETKRLIQQRGEIKRGWMDYDTAYAFMWGTAMGYIELGEYDQAIDEATRSYQFGLEHRLDPFHHISSLNALALAYALNGDRANALKYAQLLDQVDTSDHKYEGMGIEKQMYLAKIFMALRDYDQALAVMQRPDPTGVGYKVATHLFFGKALTGFGEYQKIPSAFMLAKSLLETGHVQEAARGYDAILRDPKAKENRDIYWLVLFDRGRIAEQDGNLDDAIRFYEQAVGLIEEQRASFKTEATKIGYIGDKQTVYHHLIAALFRAARHGKAFEYVERSKSRALVDLLASKKDFAIRQGNQEEIRAMLTQLDALETEGWLQEPSRRGGSPGASAARVKSTLWTKAPQLASLVSVTTVSLDDIRAQLRPDETLLEYYLQGDTLYVFLLTSGTVQAVPLDGAGLVQAVRAFRAALEEPSSTEYREQAQQLFDRLLRPVASQLATPNVIIVPHGVLHYLPFNALHDGTQYVMERHHLSYLPSASVLGFLDAPHANARQTLLAIGNPEFGARKAPLAYAEREARAIAKALPDATLLVGKAATETAVKTLGGQYTYLHLATHGVFDQEFPLHSGLLFTSDADNDGLLSAEELYSLQLNATLVTLSACETGLSTISNGDELVGLARGLLYAGSRAVVASLWSVDDEATAYLMTAFYENLKQMNTRDALQAAQLTTKQKYPHPFYWAAFQLTGQP